MNKPLAFLWRDLLEATSYRFAFLLRFSSLFFMLVTFFFLSRLVGPAFLPHLAPYGGDYFSYVVIGMALASYSSLSLFAFSQAVRRSQMNGTLEAMLATPTSLTTIVLSSSMYSFALGTIHVVLHLLAGVLIFGAKLESPNWGAAIVVLILTIVSLASIGIVAASFVLVFKQGDPVTTAISSASWLLSGVLYPVDVLPSVIQPISWVLPMTHALEGMRLALLGGASLGRLAPHVAALVLFAVLLVPSSLLAFRYGIHRVKLDGSPAHY